MSDLISREYMKSLGATCIASRSKDGTLFPIVAIDELPPADPTHEMPSNVLDINVFVDKQAVIDEISRLINEKHHIKIGTSTFVDGVVDGYARVLSMVNRLPSVQPERKRGEWIYGENDGQDGWYCSECGLFIPWYYDYYGLDNIDFIADFNTCPKCDTKMLKYTGMRGDSE